MNPMHNIKIEKITLNIGAGKDVAKLDKGVMLLKHLTGRTPAKTLTDKRIAAWGLRPGLPVGCKLTLRGEAAEQFLARLIYAKDNKLPIKSFDKSGNLSFGVPEYIDIKDAKYIPEIGITGLEVSVTLGRPGYRIKRRKVLAKKVGPAHLISKADAIDFIKSKFNVTVEGA